MIEQNTTLARERLDQRYQLSQALEAVKAAVPVEVYLEHLGVEVRHNRSRCPIHQGDNPQVFSVKGDRWYCFRCDEGGDVIDLAQAVEGGELWEAVASLAETFGVDLPQRSERWRGWQDEKGRRRHKLRDNLATSYQRRYFRAFYSEYLRSVEPELRAKEAEELWSGLRSLAIMCAEQRMQGREGA